MWVILCSDTGHSAKLMAQKIMETVTDGSVTERNCEKGQSSKGIIEDVSLGVKLTKVVT